jgi:hypothetical protein
MVKGLEVFREHFQSAGNSLEADESCIATSQTTRGMPHVDSGSWCDVEGNAKVVDVIPGDMPPKYFGSMYFTQPDQINIEITDANYSANIGTCIYSA